MNRWAKSGVLNRVFEQLQRKGIVKVTIEVASLDSTSVKVHPDTTVHRQVPRRMDDQASYGCRGRPTPEGRKLLNRLGPQRGNPPLVMDRAYSGDQTRRLAFDMAASPNDVFKSIRKMVRRASIEFGKNSSQKLVIIAFVVSEDSVSAKVGKLQQSCVGGLAKVWDVDDVSNVAVRGSL